MYKKLLFVIYVDIPELKFISINSNTDQYVSCLQAEKKANCEYHFQDAGGAYLHGRGTFFLAIRHFFRMYTSLALEKDKVTLIDCFGGWW